MKQNESLNNTCILFDPKDEAQQKAIIKYFNDNGWPFSRHFYMTKKAMDNCIGVNEEELGYWPFKVGKYKVIDLPKEYYPIDTPIVESDAMQHLIDKMTENNVRVTFGLQSHHIDHIEAELQRWRDMPPLSDGSKVDPKYIKYVWEKLGKELSWEPMTLLLYYFEHLEDTRK